MVTYAYACDEDGPLDVQLPMGTAAPVMTCPRCGASARRVYAPPMTSWADPRRMAAIDHTRRSADVPDVVTALPPGRPRRRVPTGAVDPRVARLPRP